MRKIDQKQRHGGGKIGTNNGFIPSSFRSLSSYLRIVSSGASTVASTVRSAASAASTIVDRDNDPVPDQVLCAGFDKLEHEPDHSHSHSRRVLLLGFQFGFQVWDVEDANNVRNIVSRYDGAVFSMQLLPKPISPNHSQIEHANSRPILVICADGSFSASGNPPVNGGSVPTVVWFYSLKSQSYIKELKFRSVVYSVRCSSRIVAVLQSAQIHCFDVGTLEREYTILTNPISTTSSRFENIGVGPLAVGPRWIAYSGTIVALPNTRVSPQHLTHSKTFSSSVNGTNGTSIVAHYAKQSSKQLAVGIVTLGDIGYKKLSRYYSDFMPDGNVSQQVNESKDRVENVGMVIVRDVVSKSVIAQFKAHDSPIASLSFDPSGTLLVTASVHGHNFNVFQIMPRHSSNSNGLETSPSYIHLYKLQRGFTNAVIQDISFSVDSKWIMISSSRGTSHLFAISQESDTTNVGSLGPQTLSAVSRIRSGNNTWKNVNHSHSGVIASTFYNSKSNSNNTNSDLSKYHMLVFSSSGSVIQYALRFSSEVNETYSDDESRFGVEPIQKWNICHKQNRREREETIDIYGENGHTDSRRVFPEITEKEKESDYFDGFISKVKKENVGSFEERNHVYISEAELQMHESKIPLWAKAQIYFQSMKMDDVEKNMKGEFEIENIPSHTVEARPRYLVPAVNHFQGPKMTRVSGLDYNGSSTTTSQISGLYDEKVPRGSDDPMYADVSENGEDDDDDASQTPIEEEDRNGVVNSDSCPISDTQPETVNNNIDCSVSGTHSKLVHSNNNIIGQVENRFEDEGG